MASTAWSEILLEAFYVILLSRRADGMWAFPLQNDEPIFAVSGSKEYAIRMGEGFGFASITVTHNALTAINQLSSGNESTFYRQATSSILQLRDAQGGFGSMSQRLGGGTSINAQSRHTAMAINVLVDFPSHLPVQELQKSVLWLLDEMTTKGGWTHERSRKENQIGHMSTSCSIAALAKAGRSIGDGQTKFRLESAVEKSIHELSVSQNTIWTGDGGSPNRVVTDSALSVQMLASVRNENLLVNHIELLDGMVARFFSLYELNECSQNIKREAQPAHALTAALLAYFTVRNNGVEIKPGIESTIAANILEAWTSGEIHQTFTAWDWINLARVSSRMLGTNLEHEHRSLAIENVSRLREKQSNNSLTKGDLKTIPKALHLISDFILSYGSSLPKTDVSLKDKLKRFVAGAVENWLYGVAALLIGSLIALIF